MVVFYSFWRHWHTRNLIRDFSITFLIFLSFSFSTPAQNIQWDKTIGGDQMDYLYSVQQTKDGGYILGGSSESGISGDKTQSRKSKTSGADYWVVKLNADGSKSWDKTFGGTKDDQLIAVQPTPDGGYLLGGYSTSENNGNKSAPSKGGADYWIVKIDAQGNKVWDKSYGGNAGEILTLIQPTKEGGYILGGSSTSGINGDKTESSRGGADFWFLKIDTYGNKLWDKTIGSRAIDHLSAFYQTSDGGFILGGSPSADIGGEKSENSKGYNDFWVVKLNADGSKAWDKTIGGEGNEILYAILQTLDGGYILGGWSNSEPAGDKTASKKGDSDYWVVKLNAKGTIQWDKTYGGKGVDELKTMQPTRDGGFILAGDSKSDKSIDKSEDNRDPTFDDYGEHSTDFWLVKIKADGTELWDKTLGTSEFDLLTSLQQTSNGGYILGGYSSSGISGDKTEVSRGGSDYWVLKLDNHEKQTQKIFFDSIPDINYVQQKTLSLKATATSGLPVSFSVVQGPATVKGNTLTFTGQGGLVIVKATQAGNADFYPATEVNHSFMLNNSQTWSVRFGSSDGDPLTSVIKTSDGGYLAGGYSLSGKNGDKTQNSQGSADYWIVKTNRYGKKLWDKRFGGTGPDYLSRVIQTLDGGYLLAGSSLSGKNGDKTQTSQHGHDYWIIKIDAAGNKQWDKRYGGTGADRLIKVVQLKTGEYMLGGYSNSPASGDKSQNSWGENDFWLVKIRATGTKIWDKRYGGSQDETLGSFTETRDGGFLLGGDSFSEISGDKTQANRGSNDFWVVRVDKDGNKLWDKTFGGKGGEKAITVGRSHGENFFIAGSSTSGKSNDKSQDLRGNIGASDFWIVKIDAKGNKIWDKGFGGDNIDFLEAGTYTFEGSYVIAGTSYSGATADKSEENRGRSDYWVVKIDANGNKQWDKTFGGMREEEVSTVFQTTDGGLLVGGHSDSEISGDVTQPEQGRSDYWLLKISLDSLNTADNLASRTTMQELPTTSPVKVLQFYPNPFHSKVTVQFTLPQTQPVTVKIYDSQGREVKNLFQDEVQANQTYQLKWESDNNPAGLYYLQLQTPTTMIQSKLLLTK
ncbi:T9SS type A sorting domain-containing protein [Adhaeribacter radiodurans]|uniref:T9SS type A sorting domain-containing protein n=1 Tax=Adhaeribacter radiodurans TaxID=2745197 RepID=A0A7L7L9J9_9BACT|nr:T9SS type A sorting domain-containing protein [Adhaeribacter radiodurans]QMU29526.1 T9SS type A sorting domain-containing protein [Adhaeribacter radiodurans]